MFLRSRVVLSFSINNCNVRVNKLAIWRLVHFFPCFGCNRRQVYVAPDRMSGFPSAALLLDLHNERSCLLPHIVCP